MRIVSLTPFAFLLQASITWEMSHTEVLAAAYNNFRSATVNTCGNNMWCCQNDAEKTSCCAQKSIFYGSTPIDFVRQIPLAGQSMGAMALTTTTSLLSTDPTGLSSTPSPAPASSTKSNNAKVKDIALGAGLGVLVMLILAAVIFLSIRIRQRASKKTFKQSLSQLPSDVGSHSLFRSKTGCCTESSRYTLGGTRSSTVRKDPWSKVTPVEMYGGQTFEVDASSRKHCSHTMHR